MTTHDPINHPQHYTTHPSGIECIDVTRHMGFNLGNAVKYIWRADLKNNAIEDLKKAIWYLQDEINKREAGESVEAAINRDAVKRAPSDDWTVWHGGRMPSETGGGVVDIRYRGGRVLERAVAMLQPWEHTGGPNDIVAYRVAEEDVTAALPADWTLWLGGQMPPEAEGQKVDLTMRCGKQFWDTPAKVWHWGHLDNRFDIVAYRVVE